MTAIFPQNDFLYLRRFAYILWMLAESADQKEAKFSKREQILVKSADEKKEQNLAEEIDGKEAKFGESADG